MSREEGGRPMSKVGIAVIAFILGASFSALFRGQSQTPKDNSPNIRWPSAHLVFDGGRAGGGGEGAAIDLTPYGSKPMFNSLSNLPILKKFTFFNIPQRLDGLNCTDCSFDNAVLLYGGGAVDIKGSKFSGTTELRLEGAAANTITLLEFLNVIPAGRLKYKLPIPNKPIIRRATTQKPQTMDFTAPFIGPK
jgi:hypothetical protein